MKNIETAFSTLIDKKARADYDAMLVESGDLDESILSKKDERKPIPTFADHKLIDEKAFFSVSILKSIEENQAESLPPSVYLKNFLKIYADLLQLDPKKIDENK